MVITYKIELPREVYEEIFIPFLDKAQIILPTKERGDNIVVYIRRKAVFDTLRLLLLRQIDDLEVIQSAFHKINK